MSYLPKLLIAAALFVVTPMTTNADLRGSAHDSESYTTRYVSAQRGWRGDRHYRGDRYRNNRGYYYSQPYQYYYRTPRNYYYYDGPYYSPYYYDYDYYYYPRGSVGVGPLQFYWR
jgi:hypothetical protein